MIIDLKRFLRQERPYWNELDRLVGAMEQDSSYAPDLPTARRLHYLFERTSTDLAKVKTFASEPDLTRYLENLVSRAYGHIHEVRGRPHRLAPVHWFFVTLPCTFRRHVWAFWLAIGVTLGGSLLGGAAVALDPDAKTSLLPFGLGDLDPRQRVQRELEHGEKGVEVNEGMKGQMMGFYIQNNVSVSIMAMGLGISWGIGTIIVLFNNGVLLGGVVIDYAMAGEGAFLTAWLLPHGAIELPAIFVAGQAGLVLGRAMIGWGSRISLRGRLRQVTPDLVTLMIGVALMLVWAGFVEAYASQIHRRDLYWVKISFGCAELIALALFLGLSGRWSQGGENTRA